MKTFTIDGYTYEPISDHEMINGCQGKTIAGTEFTVTSPEGHSWTETAYLWGAGVLIPRMEATWRMTHIALRGASYEGDEQLARAIHAYRHGDIDTDFDIVRPESG